MADVVAPPPPPAGWRARGAQPLHDASGARAAAVRAPLCYAAPLVRLRPPRAPARCSRSAPAPQRRAARLPAGALQALPSVSLPDDSSTSTLVLFVLLVVVINSGLLHTLLWGLFLVRRPVARSGSRR
jgi:hypothetical protein